MFAPPSTDSLKCPITCELFRDPVIGQDGHTYERNAITEWLRKRGESPITREPMTIESLRPNHIIKQLIDEFQSTILQKHFVFKLDVDIKKTKKRPIFQAPGKTIYEAEWLVKRGPPVVLLKIEGAKACREASYYVQLGCHPHIVHTYGMAQNESNSLMLVQEYATEGDLAELLKEKEFRPSQPVLIEIFLQIIDAMIYLVEYGIVHGDLACRNVLVFRFNHSEPQENLVKLTDFGLTRASSLYSIVGSTASTTLAVVPFRYAAPEVLQSSGLSNYSEKSDIYAMGVLMWEACSQGQLPFVSIEDENEVRRCKLAGKILSKPDNCNEALWNIIIRCWNQQPEARPTFKILKQLLTEYNNKKIEVPQQRVLHIPSTIMIGCEFCNKHLPELRELIHNQVSDTLAFRLLKVILIYRLLLNWIFLDGDLVKME
jgi:serine/threonine protein kinase